LAILSGSGIADKGSPKTIPIENGPIFRKASHCVREPGTAIEAADVPIAQDFSDEFVYVGKLGRRRFEVFGFARTWKEQIRELRLTSPRF
jgi:hypothetical protein